MKKITLFVLSFGFLCLNSSVFGQSIPDSLKSQNKPSLRGKNTLSFELPVAVTWFAYSSLVYERIFFSKEKSFFAAKIGTEVFGTSNSFTYNKGKGRHYLEVGFGQHVGWSPYFGLQGGLGIGNNQSFNNRYSFYPIFGYRFHPLKRGIIWGAYLRPTYAIRSTRSGTPISGMHYEYSHFFHSVFALKIGYNF